ncbi:MAG: ABC transporter ATP-binding protein [Deltaproteobacteria bacterium]|nr:ABC transporter ATP-binding protein [Deltaproteobacteria bacterium]
MFFEVKDMVVHYDRNMALKGISLQSGEGEIITLIGANGAGKSTALRAISGLQVLTSGEIWFDEKKISGWAPHQIVSLGIAHAPEGRHVFPYMTVGENLLMGAYLRKGKPEVRQDLERVYHHFPRLKERLKQEAGKLSGGEQQMLTMGRALMANPRLLLLDEPSLGLSPIMVREIAKAILEINAKRRVSMILVEQNARMALKLSSIGHVLETGKIVLSGPSFDLLNNDHVRKAYLGG